MAELITSVHVAVMQKRMNSFDELIDVTMFSGPRGLQKSLLLTSAWFIGACVRARKYSCWREIVDY